MEFCDRLKELRTEAKLTQAEFAKRLGVSFGAIGNWESGARIPRQELLERIADFFNVPMDYLLGREDNKPKLTIEETWLVQLYRRADETDKEAIQLILRKYGPPNEELYLSIG